MTTSTKYFPWQQPKGPTARVPEHRQTLHVGTFAEGQRAVPLTVTYSPDVGSFASVERR
jgi:hypothetical protein